MSSSSHPPPDLVKTLISLKTLDLNYRLTKDDWILDESYQVEKMTLTPNSPKMRHQHQDGEFQKQDNMNSARSCESGGSSYSDDSVALSDTVTTSAQHSNANRLEKCSSTGSKCSTSSNSTSGSCQRTPLSRDSSLSSTGSTSKQKHKKSPRTCSAIRRNIMAVSGGSATKKSKKKSRASASSTGKHQASATPASYTTLNVARKRATKELADPSTITPKHEPRTSPAHSVTYRTDKARSRTIPGSHGVNGTPVRRKKFASFSSVPLKTGTAHPTSTSNSSSPPKDKILRGGKRKAPNGADLVTTRKRSNTTCQ
mmetsp:Transcript_3816/g.14479  ORF Transcript_3816/g.14479 Transcript_3816/m.14479 type:complete len:313 (+) Transcript_3816:950-1888(+)|eukprot:CAMPEP_0117441626 /NCGR_PEP_ID=MMETSP0759-20121206/3731_1 /TAXON_ID=63605 /ORGANISM="Percolomonas cosmopolitus, Strain WS" /LENGTH=312 /DNA_ID=CAMNT_0005233485 /DNA_START=1259 /DNA_END=2197 /DNA_ORIENTATION=-